MTDYSTLAFDGTVVYPSTWNDKSIAWARAYHGGMSQQQVDDIERDLIAYRVKRDSYIAPPTKPIKRIEIDWSPGRNQPLTECKELKAA